MNKLNHLSKTLKKLGYHSGASLIQKLGREYVENVAREGLSSKFYSVARYIERDLSEWKVESVTALASKLSKEYPNRTEEELFGTINSCFYDWQSNYNRSVGLRDSNIPPWLFSFIEDKVFPLIKEAFSEAIETLPKDSETKSGLQSWLSASTLEQLGVSNLSEFLDGGIDLWTTYISNLVHEIHHNILNHSAWKRFSTLGGGNENYNLLDAMEEGFVITLQSAYRSKNIEDIYKDFAEGMADFLISILRKIMDNKLDPATLRETAPGKFLLQSWSEIDNHLAQIAGEEMGVKLYKEKISFLKKVFFNLKNSKMIMESSSWDDIRGYLATSILQVWSEPSSKGIGYQWDFLTGDDEILLINLMKSLDKRADDFWRLWIGYKKNQLQISISATYPCIKSELEKIK